MGQEEQIEEREVLESIFPEEITGTSPSILPTLSVPPAPLLLHATSLKKQRNANQLFNSVTDISETSYRVAIKLDIPRQDDDEAEPRQLFFYSPLPTHLFCAMALTNPVLSSHPPPHSLLPSIIPRHPPRPRHFPPT